MTPRAWVYAAAILAVLAGYVLLDFVQSPRAADEATLRGNFAAEHEIGRRFRIDPASLPPPNLQRSVRNGPRAVAYAGQRLNVPPGFTATPFATGIRNPRRLLVLPNGDVLVATQSEGEVLLLRDDGSGRAASRERYAGGFNGPYGLAWRGQRAARRRPGRDLARAGPGRAVRTGHRPGRVRGRSRPRQPADRDRPAHRRAVRRGRLDGQYRRRAGAEGDDPVFRPGRIEPDELRRRHPQSDDAGRSIRRPANCGPGCRSATGSATICRPTT